LDYLVTVARLFGQQHQGRRSDVAATGPVSAPSARPAPRTELPEWPERAAESERTAAQSELRAAHAAAATPRVLAALFAPALFATMAVVMTAAALFGVVVHERGERKLAPPRTAESAAAASSARELLFAWAGGGRTPGWP